MHLATSDPGVAVSLILPSATVTSANAASLGFTFTVIPQGTVQPDLPSMLSLPGTHTLIQVPAGQPSGTYQIGADATNVSTSAGIIATYYSSSNVRTAATTNSTNYKVGDTVVLSALVFDGMMPIAGANVNAALSTPVSLASQASIGNWQLVSQQTVNANPFLAPWADLLDEQAFWANGKRYGFNMCLGNVKDERPIHGLLSDSLLWKVTELTADAHSARLVSRLAFWQYPDLMAQWPFAHEYEITYRLAGGALEVRTTITNLSVDSMPVAIGFHPYFQIPGIPLDEWVVHLPARIHVMADECQIPTGEMRPLDIPNPLPLRGQVLDDGFTDLARDKEGRARFSIEAGGKTIEVLFGANYRVATIYLPALRPGEPREFICIEPLAAIINGVNLKHQGKYFDLQEVPAGGEWIESFWIRASGI
jgi:aldose 1-epimerase